jgi:hypothetical protein
MTVLTITFGDHVDLNGVQGMVSSIAAYGNICESENQRAFRVEIFRLSKLPNLKEKLVEWDRYGFLHWVEAT